MTDDALRRQIAEGAFGGALDGAALDALLGTLRVDTLAAGETFLAPDGGGAVVVLVLAGLLVLEDPAGRASRALDAGSGFALAARRDPAVAIRAHAVRPSTLCLIDEARYARLDAAGLPAFELLLGSLPTAPGLDGATSGADVRAPPSTAGGTPDDAPPAARRGGDDRERDAFLGEAVATLMSRELVTASPAESIRDCAARMAARRISCLPIVGADDALAGLVTEADMTARVVAAGADAEGAVADVMTANVAAVGAGASVFDVLRLIAERAISHVPVTENGRLVGLVTASDIVRRQSASPVFLVREIATLESVEAIARAVAELPTTVRALVDAGVAPDPLGQLVSAVTDAVTRRLAALAERELGTAPVPWVWLACGSQGRREQGGVSDQDNALVIDDTYEEAAHGAWFERFARFVSDGLARAGYAYCPGDMMATNPRWRQPASVWRARFLDWIANPVAEAQLLASVMFDLRPIVGDASLYGPLQREALAAASRNTLFVAHMTGSSLGLRPPLGLFGRLSPERRGPHRGTLDLKARGTAPIVDLARLYALSAAVPALGTAERLAAAPAPDTSPALSADARATLGDAWTTVAAFRLRAQAERVRRGEPPDNRLDPATLSRLERERLRDAFAAVADIQSALASRASVR